MEQLGLPLEPHEPYSLRYFVSHSGVAAAVEYLEATLRGVLDKPSSFFPVYVFGGSGAGKKHLCRGYLQKALDAGISPQMMAYVELSQEPGEDEVSRLVATFESLKASGGLLLISGSGQAGSNPHLLSRLKAAQAFHLLPPQEEELYPVLVSLLERRNLRLSPKNVEYLLSRIPRNPLSFADISAKIDDVSLSYGKPARFGLLREIVMGDAKDED